MLLRLMEPPEEAPTAYQPGSPDEAALHLYHFGWLWVRNADWGDWLVRGTLRHQRPRRRRSKPSQGSSKKRNRSTKSRPKRP
jgi:hypothetical protein